MKGKFGLLIIFLFFALIPFASQWFRVKPKVEIQENYNSQLQQLGRSALLEGDVPVAALLIYKNEIIGEGFNTVYKDQNLGGHAEINAISAAFQLYGSRFSSLNRDSLVLYSTFEPCEMCKGALLHYNIKKVYFEQEKEFSQGVNSTLRSWLYDLKKGRFDAPNLQENLFLMHPDYPKEVKR